MVLEQVSRDLFPSIAVIPASREQSSENSPLRSTNRQLLAADGDSNTCKSRTRRASFRYIVVFHPLRALAVCLLRRARVNSNAAVDQLGRMGCNAHWSTRHAPAGAPMEARPALIIRTPPRPSTPVQMARPAARAFGLSGGCRLGRSGLGIVSCEENTGVWALFGTATCGAISIGGIVRVNSADDAAIRAGGSLAFGPAPRCVPAPALATAFPSGDRRSQYLRRLGHRCNSRRKRLDIVPNRLVDHRLITEQSKANFEPTPKAART